MENLVTKAFDLCDEVNNVHGGVCYQYNLKPDITGDRPFTWLNVNERWLESVGVQTSLVQDAIALCGSWEAVYDWEELNLAHE